MKSNYPDKAIPLVTVDPKTSKYVLTNQAVEFLKSVPGPIGVVSVAGLYRTGKSYLLNRMLLNRPDGFGVGPTVNPCTKGLWCWGAPIKGTSSDGQQINIIVIDTEGIGALDEDQTHDTRIFTLAILSSSCFIYNSTGSIDENALENLSLVVNLTKHIQVNTEQIGGQEDPDRIASYFPSFLWVVRDFTLQLLDPEGNKITQKEYLEKALSLQKGYSEDIQQKNKIRKLLTTYFKDRDCCTMIRPHSNEQILQNLDKTEINDLRPEFVGQILDLRQKVINRIRPKTFHGQKLNGEMYISMMSSYVSSINEGAVPNIENAWSYMCREKCSKVFNEAFQLFEKEINDVRIPCSEQEFSQEIERIFDEVFYIFKKQAVGDDIETYLTELKKKMKLKIKDLSSINEKESQNIIKQHLKTFISRISQKIKNNQYTDFSQFERELKQMEKYGLDSGVSAYRKEYHILSMIRKMLEQGCNHIFKHLNEKLIQMKKISDETKLIYEKQINHMKTDLEKDKSEAKETIQNLDREKIEMNHKIMRLQSQIQSLQKQKSCQSDKLSKNLLAKKTQFESLKEKLENKIRLLQSSQVQQKKAFSEDKNQWEKEKVLLEQRVKKQKEKIQELQSNERKLESTYQIEKTQLNQKLKEENQSYELKIQELTRNINKEKDERDRLTEDLSLLQEKFTSLQQKFEGKEKKYRQEMMVKKSEIERLKYELQDEKMKMEKQFSSQKDDLVRIKQQFEQKTWRKEKQINELKNQKLEFKNKLETDLGICSQNLEYEKQRVRELEQKIKQIQNSYKNTIEILEKERQQEFSEQQNKRFEDLKMNHRNDIERLQNEIDQLKELKQRTESEMKKREEGLENQVTVLTTKMKTCEEEKEEFKGVLSKEKNEFQKYKRQSEKSKDRQIKDVADRYKRQINELEGQIEEMKQKMKISEDENEQRIQKDITQLKNYYEMEKQSIQKKLLEQKEKCRKKINELTDEHENFIEEKTEEYEMEIQRLQIQLEQQRKLFQQNVPRLENERNILEKDLSNLKNKLAEQAKEFKNRYDTLHHQHESQLKNMNEKIDLLQKKNQAFFSDIGKKQNQIISLKHQKEGLLDQMGRQTEQLEEAKRDLSNLKEKYEFQIEDKQNRIRELTEGLQKQININSKKIAMLQQENEFKQSKVNQLEEQKKSQRVMYEEQLKKLKENTTQEISFLKKKNQDDKSNFDEKMQKLKRLNHEQEMKSRRQLSELDKQIAVVSEKCFNWENKFVDLQRRKNNEIQYIKDELSKLKQNSTSEKKYYSSKIETLEQNESKLKEQFATIRSEKERETKLLENEVSHWKQSLEKQKSENFFKVDQLTKALDNAQRKNSSDKSTADTLRTEMMNNFQKRNRSQIMNLNEKYGIRERQMLKKIEYLDNQLKKYTQEASSEKLGKETLSKQLQEKKKQYEALILSLTDEKQKLREEKERGIEGYKVQLEDQKKNYKEKISDLEGKMNELKKKNDSMILQMAITETKYKFENQNKDQVIAEYKDNEEKLEKKIERLNRQNERLKTERRKNNANTSHLSRWGNTTFVEEKKTQKEEVVDNKENTLHQ